MPPAAMTDHPSSIGTSRDNRPAHVIVVGAGIAGMAAAIRLAEHGVRVTLLETRKKLGGRATSFADVRSGEVLDNCQHVVLGCCTNYLDFLARVGSADKILWYTAQYWAEEGGHISVVHRGHLGPLPPLPAPSHFGWSFLRAKFLTYAEAVSIGRCCIRMLSVDRRNEENRTFAAFLKEHGQTERTIRRFWSPVVVSACNLDCDRVASSSALHVFQEGFFANQKAADIGISSVPLVDLYANVESLIAKSGGTVHFGSSVTALDTHSVTLSDYSKLHADAVICAVPVERVSRLIDPQTQATDPRFAMLETFTHSPILGVHLRFDRPVMGDMPHCVLVDKSTQWLFRKDASGTAVHAVISAADNWLPIPEDEIGRRVAADIQSCLPAARDAQVVSVRAVKEKLATFAPLPGLERSRPNTTGPSGIILAGDYTNTGWPATMEGAARSGYTAAAAALNQSAETMTMQSLPIAKVARFLGLKA